MSWIAAGVGVAGLAVSVGTTAASGGFSGKKGGTASSSGFPTYQGKFKPIKNMKDDPLYGVDSLNAQMPGLQQAAAAETAFQTNQREGIYPGSGNQFRLANNILTSELRGQVPQDVVDFTNRTVAQRLGGGFNPFTQGGQAPNNFARNIGQTSYGIQQNALQQAPAWQQLANSFVIGIPQVQQQAQNINQLKYQYDALNTDINKYNTEGPLGIAANQYQNQTDQWNAGQIGQQQQAQQFNNALGAGASLGQGVAALASAYQYNTPSNLNQGTYNGLPVMRPAQYNTGQGWQNTIPRVSNGLS